MLASNERLTIGVFPESNTRVICALKKTVRGERASPVQIEGSSMVEFSFQRSCRDEKTGLELWKTFRSRDFNVGYVAVIAFGDLYLHAPRLETAEELHEYQELLAQAPENSQIYSSAIKDHCRERAETLDRARITDWDKLAAGWEGRIVFPRNIPNF